MTHKFNASNVRVGVIRDWHSKWNSIDPIVSNVNEFIILNGDNFKNLQVTRYFSIRCTDDVFVKMMKKR